MTFLLTHSSVPTAETGLACPSSQPYLECIHQYATLETALSLPYIVKGEYLVLCSVLLSLVYMAAYML
jgi:hypothetical protein